MLNHVRIRVSTNLEDMNTKNDSQRKPERKLEIISGRSTSDRRKIAQNKIEENSSVSLLLVRRHRDHEAHVVGIHSHRRMQTRTEKRGLTRRS